MNLREHQEKLKDDFIYWATKKIGINFIIILIGISIIAYGFICIPWIIYVDGIPEKFNDIFDFLFMGNIKPFYSNPIYFIFIGVSVMFLGLLRVKGLIE